jgi:hypothetical protein
MQIEIKSRFTAAILFTATIEAESASPIRDALVLAAASRADLSGADLSGANLSGADLSGANLSGANLSRADLSGADLSGADLSGADLSRANLYGVNLSRADLYGANLYGANLYGANLSRANLSGVNLSRADLYGANLYGVNLYGANLYGANLSGADGVAFVLKSYGGSARRSDGYDFIWFTTEDGEVIRAGCRTFSLKEFKAHVAAEYPSTPKAKETLRILSFLKGQAAQERWY